MNKILDIGSKVLLIVGGINWGLAIWNINIVSGLPSYGQTIVYGLIAASALIAAYKWIKK